MSDTTNVPFGDNANETATLLLAAAEELDGFDQSVVLTNSDGEFVVPTEVADKAGFGEDKPAKKTAAKKTAAKKE